MRLEELKIPKGKLNILQKQGLVTVEEFLYKEPRKYYYFDQTFILEKTPLLMKLIEEKTPVALLGTCKKVSKKFKDGRSLIKILIEEKETAKLLYITIIGEYQKYSFYQSMEEKAVIVGGVLQYLPPSYGPEGIFTMLNPLILSTQIQHYKRILPVYSKYKGISAEYYQSLIKLAYEEKGDLEYLPFSLLTHYKLPTFKEAAEYLHFPKSKEEIEKARKRKIFDDMLYFACKMEEQAKLGSKKSPFQTHQTASLMDMINNLPFSLTNGQEKAIWDMINRAQEGKQISALLQGDVGTGKTIVAFCLMLVMAENGYQSILMAPTTILAHQHYQELEEKVKKYGLRVAYLSDEVPLSKRKKLYKEIAAGDISLIVGTHICLGKGVQYKNLGLAITDEEHKFGVMQREALLEKGGEGIHHLIMSATPIPRTLASTIYGEHTRVYTMELPAERKPIQTAVCTSYKPVLKWLEKEIKKGRQGYIVCPLISQADEKSRMKGVASIEESFVIYNQYFIPKGIKVEMITGKTPKEKQSAILQDFQNNHIQILIATTVIEVGINNPNATVMVISGAERFGLATLHQLRGRVGRGSYASYCILQKSVGTTAGANLDILCRKTNGLEIAIEDLKNRGTGNLLGKEQSGKNKFIELMLTYPNMYEKTKQIAKVLCENHTGKDIIRFYEEYFS